MWGNLAGRLGATDINATLEKIGNAVAPREDDDDEYYDDDDDGDRSDSDYEEYGDDDDEYSGEGIINKVAGASPFRLAGILTRALDDRNPDSGKTEVISNNNSHTSADDDTGNKILYPSESFRTNEKIVSSGEENITRNDFGMEETKQEENLRTEQITALGPTQLSGSNIQQSIEQEISGEDKIGLEQSSEVSGLPTQNLPRGADDLSQANDVETKCKEYKTFDPMTKERKNRSQPTVMNNKNFSSTVMIDEAAMTDQLSTKTKSLTDRTKTQTEKNKSTSTQPLNQKEYHKKNIENNFYDARNVILSGNNAKGEEKEVKKCDFNSENIKAVDDLPCEGTKTAMAKTTKNSAVARREKTPQRNAKKNDTTTTVNKDIKSKASTTMSIEAQAIPNLSDTIKFERTTKNSAMQCNDDDVDNENDALSSISEKNSLAKHVFNPNAKPLDFVHNEGGVGQHRSNEKVDLYHNELQMQLEVAKEEIESLKMSAQREKEKAQAERESLIAKFQSKEARLLQATSEENQNQTMLLQQEYSSKIANLEESLLKAHKESQDEQSDFKRLLRESYSKVDLAENELKATVKKYEKEIAQVQQREEHALRKVDDRMAQTMAVLDERDEEISRLKKSIKSMESKLNEHQEGEEEAEEELEEVHQENDSLRQTIEKLELEKKNLKDQVASLKSGSEEISGLRMELTMLREERNRERTKNQAVMDSAVLSRTELEAERDNALSELRDSKQQLAATLGDLEISRADYARITMANENLQSALEAFQDERRAEMQMIDEQRRESEEAIKSAHATATSALKQIHESEMYEIQKASDNAVKNVMHEMELVEGNIEKLKSENNQMRRSLDEAIHRLQTTQEDVIDRNVMKNILLDWCTLNEKSKRHQVLQVMANLLHFTEDEKEKVHLTSKSLDSVRAKVVGALAAPLPPSKADVEHLEGSNVHEKWVNFLMAETDDI